MNGRPTADAFIKAFNGPPYGVVGPRPVVQDRAQGPGWGTSRDEVSEVTLHYLEGRARHEITVNTSIHSRATLPTVQILVVNLLLHSLWESRPLRKFPIDIRVERQKLILPVNGREHRFTAYSAGPVMRAVAELNDVSVTVEGPVDVVPRLRIASLTPTSFVRWLAPRNRS